LEHPIEVRFSHPFAPFLDLEKGEIAGVVGSGKRIPIPLPVIMIQAARDPLRLVRFHPGRNSSTEKAVFLDFSSRD